MKTKEQEEKSDDNIDLDELRRNCTGYNEEGWPKTASPHAIHHKECDGCKRECPLTAKKING